MTAPNIEQGAALSAQHGIVHGFFDRAGGASTGHCESLNVGSAVGDAPRHVAHNRDRVRMSLGGAQARLVFAQQVHGTRAATLDAQALPPGEADILLTRHANVWLGLYTADCAPLLLSAPGAVAAAHAGWRGTAAGVAGHAVRALCALAGAAPAALHVAVGPTIGPCCYQVSADVAGQLQAASAPGAAAVAAPQGPQPVDLAAFNLQALVAAGVPAAQVSVSTRCTACVGELFSHRRDAGHTGRQAAVIGLRR